MYEYKIQENIYYIAIYFDQLCISYVFKIHLRYLKDKIIECYLILLSEVYKLNCGKS